MEDFSKQKIVWKRIGSVLRFCYENDNSFCLDSTCFATGSDIKYLVGYLNSKVSIIQLIDNSPKTGTGDVITSVQALEPLLIPLISELQKKEISNLVDKCLSNQYIESHEIKIIEDEINKIVFEAFDLNDEEINFIMTL